MFKYLTTLILASSIAFAADASAADVKIGAISVPYIIQSIPQTKAAEAKIKKATVNTKNISFLLKVNSITLSGS